MLKSKSSETEVFPSPLKNRISFERLSQKKTSVNPFSILLNRTKSKAFSQVGEKIFNRSKSTNKIHYCQLVSFKTQNNDQAYQLTFNGKLSAPEGTFAYVILEKGAGQYELRIGMMHHYYLAGKSYEVIAAGDIEFAKTPNGWSDIIHFNDHSGGYHFAEEDELVLRFKKLACLDVFEKVGLPIDKFHVDEINKKSKRRYSL